MEATAELDAIMAKESWTDEDCRQLPRLLFLLNQPAAKFRQRVADLSAAAGDDPSGAVAVKLGIARYTLCQFEAAQDLLTNGTDNKERRYYQALCAKQLRQWEKALENLDYAEDRGWDAREVTLERAEVQCLAGDAAAAGRTIDRFSKSSQDDPDWHYVKGMALELSSDYDTAIAHYEQARVISPAHPGATFRMAYYCDLRGDEETAIDLYREAITQTEAGQGETPEPRSIHANALLNLAVLYEDDDRLDEAERCLRRILSAHPNHLRAQLFLKDVISSRTMLFDEDEAKRVARRNDLLGIPVTDFELSVRARNCLKKMNIRSLGDLLHVTEQELLSYKNFGETSLAEIKQMLTSKNLRLGQLREETLIEKPEAETPAASVGDEGVLATPLAQIEFSVRARRALERLNVRSLGELANKSEPELLACRNFGQTSLNEVQQRLAEYGFRLRETI